PAARRRTRPRSPRRPRSRRGSRSVPETWLPPRVRMIADLDAGAAKLGRRGDRGKGARSAQPHVVDVELELAGPGPAGEDDGHDVLAVDAERGPGPHHLAPFAARLERPRDRHHAA